MNCRDGPSWMVWHCSLDMQLSYGLAMLQYTAVYTSKVCLEALDELKVSCCWPGKPSTPTSTDDETILPAEYLEDASGLLPPAQFTMTAIETLFWRPWWTLVTPTWSSYCAGSCPWHWGCCWPGPAGLWSTPRSCTWSWPHPPSPRRTLPIPEPRSCFATTLLPSSSMGLMMSQQLLQLLWASLSRYFYGSYQPQTQTGKNSFCLLP